VAPWHRLESEGDVSLGALGPGAVFATNVVGGLAGELMLGNSKEIAKALTGEVNEFFVVLDTIGDNEALLGGNVVHNELLEAAGIQVANIGLETMARHTEGIVAVGSAEDELLSSHEGIKFLEMMVKVVSLLVL